MEFVGVTADIYEKLVDCGEHILVAGMTGSGKSVIMNGMINSILYRDDMTHQMILCDVKMVEFSRYEDTKHCLLCAITPEEVERALEGVLNLIKDRLKDMKDRGIKTYDGSTVYLFIDELADLVLTNKKIINLLQRVCQIGRAAKIRVVAATQCPLAEVIPTRIKVNFGVVVGLHTQTAQHSRNIIEVNGCEKLPKYGEALIKYPAIGVVKEEIPLIPDYWIDKVIEEDI